MRYIILASFTFGALCHGMHTFDDDGNLIRYRDDFMTEKPVYVYMCTKCGTIHGETEPSECQNCGATDFAPTVR